MVFAERQAGVDPTAQQGCEFFRIRSVQDQANVKPQLAIAVFWVLVSSKKSKPVVLRDWARLVVLRVLVNLRRVGEVKEENLGIPGVIRVFAFVLLFDCVRALQANE
ncbi:hypothetical protein D9M68_843600 [compost metagenome]